MKNELKKSWALKTAIGRWAGFGPYYAMFPVSFAQNMIAEYSRKGDTIIDPFCGRGTTNYVAQVLGRNSYGCEINNVAWVYARTKTDPARRVNEILSRIKEIGEIRKKEDFKAENAFQKWAWCKDVLAFVNSARRNLDWQNSKVDRTVAAILLVYLHGRLGGGVSNQMRQCKSMSPDYSVRWWKARKMKPPQINAVEYLSSRVQWRYSKGLCQNNAKAQIYSGDARKGLSYFKGKKASMVLTSPPYMGITNYEYDNWIRLWALGKQSLPTYNNEHNHGHRGKFVQLINDIFYKLSDLTTKSATIVVRTDKRAFTLNTTINAMKTNWPNHRLVGKIDHAPKLTQTALFGDTEKKPGEVDLIAMSPNVKIPKGFVDLNKKKLIDL